jgi:hypothetical protein
MNVVEAYDIYFSQRRNATGRKDLSTVQKVTAALQQLAYGSPADAVDEYVRISKSTAIESLQCFSHSVIRVIRDQYLREPTAADTQRILSYNKKRGFPGMLSSLDCMHWA